MKVELDPPPTRPTSPPASASFSRSAKRVTLADKPEVKDREYMTSDLNLWAAPKEKGKPLDVLEEGDKVALTGVAKNGFAQILYDGQVRWVNADYLADKKPQARAEPRPRRLRRPAAGGGVSTAPCPTAPAPSRA